MNERKCTFCGEPMTTNDYDLDVHCDGDSCAFFLKKEVERLQAENKTLNEKLQAARDEIAQLKELRAEESRINELEYNGIYNANVKLKCDVEQLKAQNNLLMELVATRMTVAEVQQIGIPELLQKFLPRTQSEDKISEKPIETGFGYIGVQHDKWCPVASGIYGLKCDCRGAKDGV